MANPVPLWLLAVLLGGTFPVPPPLEQRPPDEPGFVIVEEVQFREVVRKVCKQVPDIKKVKKTIYETKEEEFCVTKSHKGAATPQTRKVLIKKEIVEEVPTYRQVVETVVEVVPCKVYRKIPCFPAPAGDPVSAGKQP